LKKYKGTTRHGVWKASNSREQKTRVRHDEQIYSRGELRRPKLLRADVAQTHWWRNLNSPWRM